MHVTYFILKGKRCAILFYDLRYYVYKILGYLMMQTITCANFEHIHVCTYKYCYDDKYRD